jgi:predicted Zn-dependent peptidase
MWTEALNVVVDLAARPLNRPEDIEAERQIIGEEIREYESNADHLSALKARLRAARAQQLPARARVTPSTNGY